MAYNAALVPTGSNRCQVYIDGADLVAYYVGPVAGTADGIALPAQGDNTFAFLPFTGNTGEARSVGQTFGWTVGETITSKQWRSNAQGYQGEIDLVSATVTAQPNGPNATQRRARLRKVGFRESAAVALQANHATVNWEAALRRGDFTPRQVAFLRSGQAKTMKNLLRNGFTRRQAKLISAGA